MTKEEVLEFPGVVTELLPNAMFRVKLENEHEIICAVGIWCGWTCSSRRG